MHLDKRHFNSQQCIAQRDRGMCESARVNDDGVDVGIAGRVNTVDESALVVGLEGFEGGTEGGGVRCERRFERG